MKNSSKEIIESLKYFQKKSGFSETNYLRSKDWGSFEYWRYRVFRPIIKVRYRYFRKKNNPTPWLSPAATLFFDDWINKDKVGAEFGSGISTVFFAKRSKEIVSIEHFEPWYNKVVDLFKKEGLTNVEYRFIKEVKVDEKKSLPEKLKKYLSEEDSFEVKWEYENYFQSLEDFENNHFDFILVDGRARPECVFYGIDKLKSGGLMVLDNSERIRYNVVFDALSEWGNYTTSNGLTNTTFWVKP